MERWRVGRRHHQAPDSRLHGNYLGRPSSRGVEKYRAVPRGGTSKCRPLYRTDNEWAAELSNKTVHVIQHLVWIDAGGDRYRGQLGVYVKPRGWLGSFYLALIGPFRRIIVYPAGIARIQQHVTSPKPTSGPRRRQSGLTHNFRFARESPR